jgi:hypothetical protein
MDMRVRTAILIVVVAALALGAALVTAPAATAGAVSWQQVHDGRLHGSDGFTSVVVAPGGAVYAAGYTAVSAAARSDMLLVRYTANGTTSWARQWNGPLSGSDQCWDLTRDGRGGLYLAGRTAGRGGDAAVLRYSPDGKLTWSRRIDYGSAWQDDARYVQGLTRGDGAYVVVESWSGTAWRTRVLRYSRLGARVWTTALAPGTRVTGVATDAADDLYLSAWSGSAGGSEAELDSFSPAGTRRWTVRLPGDAAYTRASAIGVRPDGIVWAMDSSDDATAPGHGSVLASPSMPFAQQWGGALGLTPPYELRDVGGTADGGAIAVGRARSGGLDRGFLVQLSAAGVPVAAPLVWSDAAGCGGDLVATTSGDGAWVAGRTGAGFSALHYLPAAGLEWRYDYAARPAGRALDLQATADGGAVVVGWGRAAGAGADALILRLAP